MITPGMEPEEVVRICSNIYKNFINPRFIIRHLLKIRSLEDLSYVVRGGKAVMGHIMDFARIRPSESKKEGHRVPRCER